MKNKICVIAVFILGLFSFSLNHFEDQEISVIILDQDVKVFQNIALDEHTAFYGAGAQG